MTLIIKPIHGTGMFVNLDNVTHIKTSSVKHPDDSAQMELFVMGQENPIIWTFDNEGERKKEIDILVISPSIKDGHKGYH